MNFNRISKLNQLVNNTLGRKPKFVIEPDTDNFLRIYSGMGGMTPGKMEAIDMTIDRGEWVLPEPIEEYIRQILKDGDNKEEKILRIYQKLCEDYTYDDNVLSYVRRRDDDSFYLPDEYGRYTDRTWNEKRQQHNRRNCFEISRILASAIMELLRHYGSSRDYDVCIIWDETKTHYFVGLVTDEYCVTLDLDDFTQLKDITRLKTDLTIEGIQVLDDPEGKFGSALDRFNEGRSRFAKDHIASIAEEKSTDDEEDEWEEKPTCPSMLSEDVMFLQNAIQILKEEYNLDPAGMFEYLKEIVDTKLGARSRKKVWKEVESEPGVGKRYTRCLIVTIDEIDYLIDVTEEHTEDVIRRFDVSEMDRPDSKIIPYSKLVRSWDEDPYDGR